MLWFKPNKLNRTVFKPPVLAQAIDIYLEFIFKLQYILQFETQLISCFLLGATHCFFFPWTRKEPQWFIRVERDVNYGDKILMIRSFYFNEFLPHAISLSKLLGMH